MIFLEIKFYINDFKYRNFIIPMGAEDTISCDACGYYDVLENFAELYTTRGNEILKNFGWDIKNQTHRGTIQTLYAGAICPHCGNYSSFDFRPDEHSSLQTLLQNIENHNP